MSSQQHRQRKTQKAKRAVARDVRRQRHHLRKRRRRILFAVAAGFFALAIVASFAFAEIGPLRSSPSSSQTEGPGQRIGIQGDEHIQPGESHPPYNSAPPTSGWHYATPAQWGISATQIQDEVQLHNLEHGGVLIQYDTEDNALIGQLEAIAQRQPNYPCYLIVAPYKGLRERNAAIALTAWGFLLYLDKYDDATIQAFIKAYRDRGPEKVPCTP